MPKDTDANVYVHPAIPKKNKVLLEVIQQIKENTNMSRGQILVFLATERAYQVKGLAQIPIAQTINAAAQQTATSVAIPDNGLSGEDLEAAFGPADDEEEGQE